MADGELQFKTQIDTKGFDDGVNKLKKKGKTATDEFNNGVDNNKSNLLSLGNVAKTVGAYIGVDLFKDAITMGVQFNAQVEQYKIALTTLTGSAEEANKIIEKVKQDAVKTPFDVAELIKANQLMLSTGLNADDTRNIVLALGDAISATGGGNEELSRMIINLQQVKNLGKASLVDIKQFAYAGIDIYGLLADYLGITKQEASEMEVSWEDLSGALLKASQEGGMYFNAMINQSSSLNGQLSNLSDNLKQRLGQSFQWLNDLLKDDLVPTLNNFLSGEIDFSTFVNKIVGIGADIITSLGNSIVTNAPILIDKGFELLTNLSEGISQNLPTFLSNMLTFLQNVGTWISEQAPTWIDKGFEILSNLVQGIIDSLPTMIEKLPQVITTFANIINDNFPTILAKGGELLWQLIKGIISAIPTLIANIPQIIHAIVSVLQAFNWLSLGKTIITALGNGIGAMLGFIGNAGTSIFNAIKNAIINLPSTLLNLGKSASKGLGNALGSMISFIKDKALSIVNVIVDTIKSIPSKMLDIGKNIVKGIWEGISGMTGWILDKVGGFVDGVVDGFKDFFGIHSPSRVMANLIGKFLPQGIALGFSDEMPKSLDKMEKTLDLANEGLSVRVSQLANTSGRATASNYYGNTYTNNDNTQVINFYNAVDDPIENARRIRLAERNGYAR